MERRSLVKDDGSGVNGLKRRALVDDNEEPKKGSGIGPSYIPKPDDCPRVVDFTLEGQVMMDVVICENYCPEDCPDYEAYCRKYGLRMRNGKKFRKRGG